MDLENFFAASGGRKNLRFSPLKTHQKPTKTVNPTVPTSVPGKMEDNQMEEDTGYESAMSEISQKASTNKPRGIKRIFVFSNACGFSL